MARAGSCKIEYFSIFYGAICDQHYPPIPPGHWRDILNTDGSSPSAFSSHTAPGGRYCRGEWAPSFLSVSWSLYSTPWAQHLLNSDTERNDNEMHHREGGMVWSAAANSRLIFSSRSSNSRLGICRSLIAEPIDEYDDELDTLEL